MEVFMKKILCLGLLCCIGLQAVNAADKNNKNRLRLDRLRLDIASNFRAMKLNFLKEAYYGILAVRLKVPKKELLKKDMNELYAIVKEKEASPLRARQLAQNVNGRFVEGRFGAGGRRSFLPRVALLVSGAIAGYLYFKK